MTGPLAGMKVVELAGIGPGPMCAMLLADLGATVLRVDRKEPSGLGVPRPLHYDTMLRNRKSIGVDLKTPEGVALVLDLIADADALIEGFRPGVTERMGLGPDVCLQRNPRLVYGRMTGWGQHGPLAQSAAHDLNFIAVTGALNAIGRRGQAPSIPLNLLGDYAGGSMYLAFGILAALFERQRSGNGQVVDAAIVDGTASLMTSLFGLRAAGMVSCERGSNHHDSGHYYYDVYECADGKWVSVAAVENKFFRELVQRLDLDPAELGEQTDRSRWPRAKAVLAERFKMKTRAEWAALLEGTDVCFAPVLDLDEAPHHPHLRARQTLIEVEGVVQPAPAPRFSRSVPSTPEPPAPVNEQNTLDALAPWLPAERIDALRHGGVIA